MLRPDNAELIEVLDLFTHPQTVLLVAAVAKLQPVVFEQTPAVEVFENKIWAKHNEWTASSCIQEGIIRSSAVGPAEKNWLSADCFYARGAVGNKLSIQTLTDVLLRAHKFACAYEGVVPPDFSFTFLRFKHLSRGLAKDLRQSITLFCLILAVIVMCSIFAVLAPC